MIVLAHRGLWRRDADKNSLPALREALLAGFGVETDLRDDRGRVVISHDPPAGDVPSLEQFLDLVADTTSDAILALNVKSDGLHGAIDKALRDRNIGANRYFLFDMSPPDARGYLQRKMPCFSRQSEIEPVPAFIDQAAGVWLDCFAKDWINKDIIRAHCDKGRRVALVSPELHGRDKSVAWTMWRDAHEELRAEKQANLLMICTDHPAEARSYFGED